MKRVLVGLICTILLASRLSLAADPVLPQGFDPQRHMLVSEVRQGMKGYGLSVFRGTKIERFEVEVLSVLRNFNPRHDVILVSCKGANLEHTGSIAGMSGSPIYLKDGQGRERMAGAFAYGWPLMKDPVGGVQPIEYMLALPGPRKVAEPTVTTGKHGVTERAAQKKIHWSLEDSIPLPWKQTGDRKSLLIWRSPLAAEFLGDGNDTVRLRPLATPLMSTGVSKSVFEQFEPVFRSYGLAPLQAGGAAGSAIGPPAKLEPGSAIAVPLMTGDLDMTAIGTVTEVIGDRVLAFGHPFFSEGEVSLPMGSGYIHTVIANLMNSFKLGSATGMQGTLHADQLVGIAGQIGHVAATVPLEVRCVYEDGTFDRTYHFNASQHPKFTPLLAALSASVATTSNRELPQYHTLDYEFTLEFANGKTLTVKNRTVNANAAEFMQTLGAPIQAASENPFEKVSLKKLSGTVRVLREAKEATILSVTVPKTKYQPGEMVKAFITYRPFRGAEAILPIEFELPKDLTDGVYDLAVNDWQAAMVEEQQLRPFRFTAESTDEVFAVLKDLTSVRHDAIYVRLMRQPDGVAIGRTAMPRLPSSRRQVLMGAGQSNTTIFASPAMKIVPTDYVMDGQAHFNITIDRESKVEPARPRHDVPIQPPGNTPKPAGDFKPKATDKPDLPGNSEKD